MYANKNQEKMIVRLLSVYSSIFFLLIVCILFTIIHEQHAMAQKTTISSSSNATKLPTASNFLTYQNPTYGIKIQYPSDWTASQTGLRDYTNIIAFYSPLQNLTAIPEQLLLSMTHYSQSVTLNDYSELVNATLKQPGIQIVEAKQITLTSGNPAHSVVFIPPPSNVPFKPEIMLVWTVKGNNIYTLSFNGDAAKYSLYLPIIQKMISSFEITK
jgi:eukaryotic-like serine/threonine-protein kinase